MYLVQGKYSEIKPYLPLLRREKRWSHLIVSSPAAVESYLLLFSASWEQLITIFNLIILKDLTIANKNIPKVLFCTLYKSLPLNLHHVFSFSTFDLSLLTTHSAIYLFHLRLLFSNENVANIKGWLKNMVPVSFLLDMTMDILGRWRSKFSQSMSTMDTCLRAQAWELYCLGLTSRTATSWAEWSWTNYLTTVCLIFLTVKWEG